MARGLKPRLLYMTAEIFPYVKTGGLGDVSGALPQALEKAGMDVRLFLPGYPEILKSLKNKKHVADVPETEGGGRLLCGRLSNGMTAYILDKPEYFDRSHPYTYQAGKDWPDNHLRFGNFCRAAVFLAEQDLKWRPDIIHGHDWHCGLMPAYVHFSGLRDVKTVLTIHNIAYQGLFPANIFKDLDLPAEAFSPDGLEYYGQVSFIKAGIYYADAVTTVSPTYAEEIKEPEYGCGLDGLLRVRGKSVTGILNGIDNDLWNPATDPEIPVHFTASSIRKKLDNKTDILRHFGLAENTEMPLYVIVSRLTHQKGLDLVLQAMPKILKRGARLIVLGQGDEILEKQFQILAENYPDRMAVEIGYDEKLAHRMIAGADIVMVPSRFEPCGLVQMYAMRYGSLPMVRKTGGLADSVRHQETGFVFEKADTLALQKCLDNSVDAFRDRKLWQKLQKNAMKQDFSWQKSAGDYAGFYKNLCAGDILKKAA